MVLTDIIAENGMKNMVEKRNGNKNGDKKYPILGIRIDSETLNEIETTAEKLDIKKSALVKQAIKQFFYLLDPVEKADRMMIYKNVLKFCLNHLDEEEMHELLFIFYFYFSTFQAGRHIVVSPIIQIA